MKNRLLSKLKRKFYKRYPGIEMLLKPESIAFVSSNMDDTSLGKNTNVLAPCHVYGCKIGDYSYIAMNSYVSYTEIGKFCSIGPNLVCGWGIHPLDGISTSPMYYSTKSMIGVTLSSVDKIDERKPIKIGNDVFIGANVIILDGVTIGDGAVIGAGAVVSKDIPPYAIAVGCPIQIKKYRFKEETIKKLLQIKWWDFDDDKLQDVERLFFDVDGFIEKYQDNTL